MGFSKVQSPQGQFLYNAWGEVTGPLRPLYANLSFRHNPFWLHHAGIYKQTNQVGITDSTWPLRDETSQPCTISAFSMSSVSICKIFKSVIEKTLNIIKKYQFTLKKIFHFCTKKIFSGAENPSEKRKDTKMLQYSPKMQKSTCTPNWGSEVVFSFWYRRASLL